MHPTALSNRTDPKAGDQVGQISPAGRVTVFPLVPRSSTKPPNLLLHSTQPRFLKPSPFAPARVCISHGIPGQLSRRFAYSPSSLLLASYIFQPPRFRASHAKSSSLRSRVWSPSPNHQPTNPPPRHSALLRWALGDRVYIRRGVLGPSACTSSHTSPPSRTIFSPIPRIPALAPSQLRSIPVIELGPTPQHPRGARQVIVSSSPTFELAPRLKPRLTLCHATLPHFLELSLLRPPI
ncbi:hypothetical protein C8F04DRAFT_1125577 [Mycena alexandri]|uniref:Uncharacterized protein n=1 Tax=Mycena alexandri TaxID=1745969 RepID=A0AAD6SEX9_9AGAR|nr:hypothetical protein C8F04DRAFT_1125577 [Mycena alexandri]